MAFLVSPEKVTNHNQTIYFLIFVNHFKRSETIKLAEAPTTAKIIVFAISSERILGKMLKNVPDTVPVRREILVSISGLI